MRARVVAIEVLLREGLGRPPQAEEQHVPRVQDTRAPADLAANERGARGEADSRGKARPTADAPSRRHPSDPAAAGPRRFITSCVGPRSVTGGPSPSVTSSGSGPSPRGPCRPPPERPLHAKPVGRSGPGCSRTSIVVPNLAQQAATATLGAESRTSWQGVFETGGRAYSREYPLSGSVFQCVSCYPRDAPGHRGIPFAGGCR